MDDNGDYKVGYCKPPLHTRFKKGETRNQHGRPARSKNFDVLLDQLLEETVTVTRTRGRASLRVSKRRALVMKIVNDALNGNHRAQEIILKHIRESGSPEPFEAKPYDDEILMELKASFAHPEDGSELEEG